MHQLLSLTDQDFTTGFRLKNLNFIVVFFHVQYSQAVEQMLANLAKHHLDVTFATTNVEKYPTINRVANSAGIIIEPNSIMTFYNGMPLTIYKGKFVMLDLDKFITEMKRTGISDFLQFLKTQPDPNPILSAPVATYARDMYGAPNLGRDSIQSRPQLTTPVAKVSRPRDYDNSLSRQFRSLRNEDMDKLPIYEQDATQNYFDKWSGMSGGPTAKEKIWVGDMKKD